MDDGFLRLPLASFPLCHAEGMLCVWMACLTPGVMWFESSNCSHGSQAVAGFTALMAMNIGISSRETFSACARGPESLTLWLTHS